MPHEAGDDERTAPVRLFREHPIHLGGGVAFEHGELLRQGTTSTVPSPVRAAPT
ncbi:MAG: hypothetical protein U0599_23360 [Vicinamibacteria bacterium]